MIDSPTRITENSQTLIDHLYTTNKQCILETGCLEVGISDHLMIYSVCSGGGTQGHIGRERYEYLGTPVLTVSSLILRTLAGHVITMTSMPDGTIGRTSTSLSLTSIFL